MALAFASAGNPALSPAPARPAGKFNLRVAPLVRCGIGTLPRLPQRATDSRMGALASFGWGVGCCQASNPRKIAVLHHTCAGTDYNTSTRKSEWCSGRVRGLRNDLGHTELACRMFLFFSNGIGVAGSIVVSIAVTLLLLYACSGP